MNELSPVDRALLRVSVLTFLARRIKAETDAAREESTPHLKKGDTLAVRSPLDDTRIARVLRTDPDPTAAVTDQAALEKWVVKRYPEKLVGRWEIRNMSAAIDVLRAHAPHLVAFVESVPDWAVNELVKKSATAGQPVGYGGEVDDDAPPGITIETPDGVLQVRVDWQQAESAIVALWDAHMVAMDGNIRRIGGAS